jgi:hypothetical protein
MDLARTLSRAAGLLARPAETFAEIARARAPAPPEGLAERLEATPPGEVAAAAPPADHLLHLGVEAGFAALALTLFVALLRARLGPMGIFAGSLAAVVPTTVGLLVAGVWVLSHAARALAAPMESKANGPAALALCAYATTPSFAASALTIADALAISTAWHRLAVGLGAAGTFWLLYHGLGPLLDTPPARRLSFAGGLAFLWLVLSAIAFVGPRQLL